MSDITASKIITINVEPHPTDDYPNAVMVFYSVQVGAWGQYSFSIHYQDADDRYVFSDLIPIKIAIDNTFQQHYSYAGDHGQYTVDKESGYQKQLKRAERWRKEHGYDTDDPFTPPNKGVDWPDYEFGPDRDREYWDEP